jgi:hypothetical protein
MDTTAEPAISGSEETATKTTAAQGRLIAAAAIGRTVLHRLRTFVSSWGLVAVGLSALLGAIGLAGATGHLYPVVIAGVVADMILTAMICGHMFFGPASARIPSAALIAFRITQIFEALLPAALFWIVTPEWSPLFLLVLALGIWSRVGTQAATIYFHVATGRWGGKHAA